MGRNTRNSTIRRSIRIAFASLAVFASASPAFARTSPDEFLGAYQLRETVSGYCFDQLRVTGYTVDPTANDMRVGHYFFPKVNAGAWTYDEGFESGESNSWTTDDRELVHETKYHDQLRDVRGTRRYSAKLLAGDMMRVRAEERGFNDFVTECLYERVLMVPEEP